MRSSKKTQSLVRMAILVAVIIVMAYTPLGYLHTAGLEISFLMIPVVLGAILMGPAAGAFLGGLFGLTSFLSCFGTSAFGAVLLGIQPLYTFLVCMVPRILAGWLAGLVYRGLERAAGVHWWCALVGALSGAVFNTVFFMSALILLFGRTEFIQGLMNGKNVLVFVAAFVGLQGLLEAGVCAVVGGALCRVLLPLFRRE